MVQAAQQLREGCAQQLQWAVSRPRIKGSRIMTLPVPWKSTRHRCCCCCRVIGALVDLISTCASENEQKGSVIAAAAASAAAG
jgi:hypothetical protein